MALGALDVVAVALHDQLSLHPEIGWRAIALTAGAALWSYAKKFLTDWDEDDFARLWRSSETGHRPAENDNGREQDELLVEDTCPTTKS